MNPIIVDICISDMVLKRVNLFDKIIELPLIFNIGNFTEVENLSICDFIYGSPEKKEELEQKLDFFKKEIHRYNRFRIWYSQSSPEYCGMLYVVYLLSKMKNCDIYLVNCTQNYHMENCTIYYNAAKDIPNEHVPFFLEKQVLLDLESQQNYLQEFHEYFKYKIRVMIDGKLQTITESECKDIFMKVLTKKKQSIMRVLPDVMNETALDYTLAVYAMKLLEKEGKIRIKEEFI